MRVGANARRTHTMRLEWMRTAALLIFFSTNVTASYARSPSVLAISRSSSSCRSRSSTVALVHPTRFHSSPRFVGQKYVRRRGNGQISATFSWSRLYRWNRAMEATPSSIGTNTIAPSPIGSLRHKLGLDDTPGTTSTTTAAATTAAATTTRQRRSRSSVAVVGHRGALYHHLENTIPGFVQCAEWGCDAVELDAFGWTNGDSNNNDDDDDATKASTVIVFHGNDSHPRGPGGLAGYCLGDDSNHTPLVGGRTIWDLTDPEIQSLRFNPDYAEFPCPTDRIEAARIPTLEAVLEALRPYPSMHIKIELKGPSVAVVPLVVELVERLAMTQRCSYSSFDLSLLKAIRLLRPDATMAMGALFAAPTPLDYLTQAHECGATAVHLRYDECTVTRIRDIRAAGQTSMAWTRGPIGMAHDMQHVYTDMRADGTEGRACYQALLDSGVDEICCNKPDLLIEMLSE